MDVERTGSAAWKAPCAIDPESWDLDGEDVTRWLRAIRTCREACPFLSQCLTQRIESYPGTSDHGGATGRMVPAGVIWAGTAYGETGQVLDVTALRRWSATLRSRRQVADATEIADRWVA